MKQAYEPPKHFYDVVIVGAGLYLLEPSAGASPFAAVSLSPTDTKVSPIPMFNCSRPRFVAKYRSSDRTDDKGEAL
ncbi:MAG: hypothetical protein ACJ8H8_18975 [Geminicoccaceae bacterium]